MRRLPWLPRGKKAAIVQVKVGQVQVPSGQWRSARVTHRMHEAKAPETNTNLEGSNLNGDWRLEFSPSCCLGLAASHDEPSFDTCVLKSRAGGTPAGFATTSTELNEIVAINSVVKVQQKKTRSLASRLREAHHGAWDRRMRHQILGCTLLIVQHTHEIALLRIGRSCIRAA